MANTVIQIKRSSSTAVPVNGSLSAAELAYSYQSGKLFIGTSDGLGTVAIGGQFFLDNSNTIFDVSNAAYAHANASYASQNLNYTLTNAAFAHANSVYDSSNLAFSTVNAAFGLANTAVQRAGDTITGDLTISGNLTISGITTYANTQTLSVGDNIFTLNADLPGDASPSLDAGMEINRGNLNDVSILWNEASDKWTLTNDGTTWYNIATNNDLTSVSSDVVAVFGVANASYAHANAAYATGNVNYELTNASFTHANAAYALANSATAQAANADFLSSGTVGSARISGSYTGITGVGTLTVGTWTANTITVPYGGTGVTSFTTNGILYGNNTGGLKVTAAATLEGQVLQSDAAGVPLFGMLDGGSF